MTKVYWNIMTINFLWQPFSFDLLKHKSGCPVVLITILIGSNASLSAFKRPKTNLILQHIIVTTRPTRSGTSSTNFLAPLRAMVWSGVPRRETEDTSSWANLPPPSVYWCTWYLGDPVPTSATIVPHHRDQLLVDYHRELPKRHASAVV